ncbi:mechanosensitive ion channel family protein [Pseudomonas sp. JS3066]|jgi:small conductance mechanosensitive channel|uniref:mechanosensitive ion channel family protein n=1 Tax=unclassified Pseudomonas TaxID=196821 RepID=UPI000EAA81AC|nr:MULTISPECIES: mechanosensitive ion channel family protein [unclassified Pseudomonas]AYF88274.1 mechanosensitive ion channel family protein [Pseudomonas sp. DY-1]MDH4654555.1 mechanosensitive ion channel family protein [Pseudomonas sp. BN606]MRK24149.1 mechanosensitive ion channel family protein [Pseudomonas sp. JG-B]WVK94178.1 mechanosensitive ion channel family protein [Pseudomonas sp. JS3066]
MEMNVDQLVKVSEAWLPVVLEYSGKLTLALLTLLIGWWLINVLTGRVGALMQHRRVDRTLQGFIGSLANIVLKVLLLVSVASMIGISTTSFVAAIGAAGLAIGLALQGSLANFAGGVLILLFRPFKVGDFIEAQGVSGTVDHIQIFHTVLRTGDNKTVIMPNGSLSNGIITNYSKQANRQVLYDVKVDYTTDLSKARDVLLKLAQDPRVHKDPEPVVVVSSLGDTSINLSLRLWVSNADYWGVIFKLNETVRDGLNAVGVELAQPPRMVQVVPS